VPSDGPCDVNVAIVGDNVERLAGNRKIGRQFLRTLRKAEGLTPRKGWDPFFPSRLRQFSALAMSAKLVRSTAALWEPPHPIKPVLGSLRSSEN
jgi:hypothetical protein